MVWLVAVISAYAALGSLIGVAWGWHALLVYGYFVLLSLAYVVAFVGWSRMIQHAGRAMVEHRFPQRR